MGAFHQPFIAMGVRHSAEIPFLILLFVAGVVTLLLQTALTAYFYVAHRRKRAGSGLAPLSRMDTLRRTPGAAGVLIVAMVLFGFLYHTLAIFLFTMWDVVWPLFGMPPAFYLAIRAGKLHRQLSDSGSRSPGT